MEFALPPVGEGLIEVELTRWLVAPGEAVARGQALCEVMSDKATMEVPSPFAGTVTAVAGAPGDKLAVGAVILSYAPANAQAAELEVATAAAVKVLESTNGSATAVLEAPPSPPSVPTLGRAAPPAAPSVRLLARKLGVDLAGVLGTGPDGRILVEDLRTAVTPIAPAPQPHAPRKSEPKPPDFGVPGTRVPLVGVRRKIAEQMVKSLATAPHFTYVEECDFTELVRLRAQLKDTFARAGYKLTYLPFILKAITRALRDVPVVNATFDDAKQELVLHRERNLGVAVAAPAGLVVPVIRSAEKLDLAGLAGELERLSDAARSNKLARADMAGGTFTVSSIGSIGGLHATPILNVPEVGIVAVGKVVRRPVFDERGGVRAAEMAYLSFSFDHRFIDGAVAAHFGNAVVRHLSHPAELLLPDALPAK